MTLVAPVSALAGDGDDERGLAEAARRSPDAFAVLYRRYVGRIHAFAYRRSGSREVAEEVTSATFERAWKAMPSFEWKGGGFGPWLFAIAAREVAAWYRRSARHNQPRAQRALRLVAPEGAHHDDDRVDRDDDLAAFRVALSSLAPRYQDAISLRHLAGLEADEAAAALGCSKAVLAVTLHRAKAALRRAMAARRQP